MERDVMDIVKEKEFIELTAAERVELEDLCASEEEYNQIKSMFAGIEAINWSNPTPKPETKERLDHLFAQQRPKAAPLWYNAPLAVLVPREKPIYRQPLVQIAAVGLLIFLAYPLVKSEVMSSENNQMAVLEKEAKAPQEVKKSETNDATKKEADVSSKEKNGVVTETTDYKNTDVEKVEATRESTVTYTWSAQPVTSSATRSVDLISSGVAAEMTVVEDFSGLGSHADVASTPGSTHPDGIFIGDKTEIFSVPASREPAVFDLLTSTF